MDTLISLGFHAGVHFHWSAKLVHKGDGSHAHGIRHTAQSDVGRACMGLGYTVMLSS